MRNALFEQTARMIEMMPREDMVSLTVLPPSPSSLLEGNEMEDLGYSRAAPLFRGRHDSIQTIPEGPELSSDASDMATATTHSLLRGGIDSIENNIGGDTTTTTTTATYHFSARVALHRQLHNESLPPVLLLGNSLDPATTTTTLVSVHIKVETLLTVAAVVGLFGLAMLCLACSMGGAHSVYQKCCGCCCCSRRRSSDSDNDDQHQQPTASYATVQEFVFEANGDDNATALVDNVPTTMEQLFPDLLGSSTTTEAALVGNGGARRTRKGPTPSETETSQTQAQLREPLL